MSVNEAKNCQSNFQYFCNDDGSFNAKFENGNTLFKDSNYLPIYAFLCGMQLGKLET
jgi:hypothetical protein